MKTIYFDSEIWFLDGCHCMPNWMPLETHLIFEKLLDFYSRIFKLYTLRICRPLYQLVYGLICGIDIRKIIPYIINDWKNFKSTSIHVCYICGEKHKSDKCDFPF